MTAANRKIEDWNAIDAKRIMIKIGTSTITKDQKVNREWLKKKIAEIAYLRENDKDIVIVTSGAVGAGMEIEGINVRPKDALKLQLLSGKGQALLMKLYQDMLTSHNIQTAQVLLTHHNFNTKEEVKNIKNVINSYLKEGTVPVINTNDLVTNEEIMMSSDNKFTDNDELAALVAENIGVDLLVILTDVDGLCTSDPRKNQSFNLLKTVDKITDDIMKMATKEGSMMGTGGMLSKIIAARKVAKKGIPTIVANGCYNLNDILQGKVDRTLFLAER